MADEMDSVCEANNRSMTCSTLVDKNIIGRADVVTRLNKLFTINASPFHEPARRKIDIVPCGQGGLFSACVCA